LESGKLAVERQLRVGVIFGGRSGEHEVSLASARSILAALNRQKYVITSIGITPEGSWLTGENVLEGFTNQEYSGLLPCTLLPDPTRRGLLQLHRAGSVEMFQERIELDVVIPVLHGTFGEDGTLQGLFELANIAYVGAGVVGSAVGMDKAIFKQVMAAQGIPTLEWMVVTRAELDAGMESVISSALNLAPFPLFTKPANLGSSVGITRCRSRADLVEGILEASRYDRRILIERGINAREIEVSVLGNEQPQASLPGEIRPAAEFYSYDAKYRDDRSELVIPAALPAELSERVRQLAVQAYKAIDCAGMARVDFLLDKDDATLYINEINTIPGFTQISMYPKLWEATGLPYPELLDRLIGLALDRFQERTRTEFRLEK
jgi:D-alanine-D-alanine ligase